MSIIVTKSNGTTDVTFTIQSHDGSGQVFTNQSAGLVEPESLLITHNLRPQGAKGTDRHTVSYRKVKVETTSLQNLVLGISVQFAIPRSGDITLAMVKDAMAMLTSYLNLTANITSIYNGATPEGDFNVTGPFNPSIA
jgi:hypothetical protein